MISMAGFSHPLQIQDPRIRSCALDLSCLTSIIRGSSLLSASRPITSRGDRVMMEESAQTGFELRLVFEAILADHRGDLP